MSKEIKALREINVKALGPESGPAEYFEVPQAIANYYQLEDKDGIVAILKEIQKAKSKEIQQVNKEILLDVHNPTQWILPEIVVETYNIKKYDRLILEIKEVIHKD